MKSSESKYAGCLYFTANALARKIEKLAIESWAPVKLSPSHAYLLMLILQEPGLQPGSIASNLQLTPSTVSRLIEKLEERKLLIRINEGKLTNVFPTQKAKGMRPLLKQCVVNFSKMYQSAIGKDAACTLVKQLHSISAKLDS